MKRKNIIILGAAGRDYHNFNVFFRDKPEYNVVAFTATQIPGISGRTYPPKLAGKLYPKGIKTYPEKRLPELIKKFKVDQVVFAYSDVSHEYVMHKASIVLSRGADFVLLGSNSTMLKSKRPVIAVTAVRTGAGKSPTSRKVVEALRKQRMKVVIIRHPMPYGDLKKQIVQRFESYEDLDKHKCTIEEREEYEPHLENGAVVYAGVDYGKILKSAEKECDVIVFDGGNNDISLIKPDLLITIVDPHRPGHEVAYHPGETNFLSADVIVINKIDSARTENVKIILEHIKNYNPNALVIKANSEISVENHQMLRGKKALVIEDGPTLTHGGMSFGAGTIAAKKYGAKIISVEKYAVGSIKDVYRKYSHLKNILPAMGYGKKQINEIKKTINGAKCDVVIDGSPVNLSKLLNINKPIANVRYSLDEIGYPKIEDIIKRFLKKIK